jgi:hypothetical protein
MKKQVINNNNRVSLNDLLNEMQCGHIMSIYYIAKSELPYPTFLKQLENHKFGFVSPLMNYAPTYVYNTPRESLEKVMLSGKELFVLDRGDMKELFKI